MVLATAVPKRKAATKLKNAAQATASRGDRTRVETTVAMEFAESWNPLRKSNVRANSMVMPSVLEPVHFHAVRENVFQLLKIAHGATEGLCLLDDDLRDLEGGGRSGGDFVKHDAVGRGVDEVEHVVERGSEGVDVFAIERGNKGGVELHEDGVGDLVAAMLDVFDLLDVRGSVFELAQKFGDGAGAEDQVRGHLLEHVKKLGFFREKPNHQRSSSDREHGERLQSH